jgi:hypothetical protein
MAMVFFVWVRVASVTAKDLKLRNPSPRKLNHNPRAVLRVMPEVMLDKTPYACVGCGAEFCNGSLHSTQNMSIGPEQRVRMALEAASFHSIGVKPPFIIKSI